MQRRHRSRLDAPQETIAHHQVEALSEVGDKAPELRKIVTVVGVTHDDEFSAGRRDSTVQCGSVPSVCDVHHARAPANGNLLRAIRAAVIRDDDFTLDLAIGKPPACLFEADLQGLCPR
jgi:hypothetical protein